jgi:hypothetical protein
MNNIKYVMLPRIEEKPKEIKPQPWYFIFFLIVLIFNKTKLKKV